MLHVVVIYCSDNEGKSHRMKSVKKHDFISSLIKKQTVVTYLKAPDQKQIKKEPSLCFSLRMPWQTDHEFIVCEQLSSCVPVLNIKAMIKADMCAMARRTIVD